MENGADNVRPIFEVTPWQGCGASESAEVELGDQRLDDLDDVDDGAEGVVMEPMFRSSVSYVQVCMYKVVSAWCFCTTLCRRHKLANWTLVWVEMTALR